MKSKILIVDDEESIRFAFEMALTEKGYDVKTAADYTNALDILSQYEPDLVVTDIILGGKTGVDLLSEIKNRKLNCPVIMITGEPNIETSSEAVRQGAFDYIPKPIRRETLLRIVSHGLQHKSLLDRKQHLEKENEKVRKDMEAIFGSLNEGILMIDDQLRVIQANAAIAETCGWDPAALIGTKIKEKRKHCAASCINKLKKVLKTKKTVEEVQIECRCAKSPGQVIRLTATPLKSDGINFSGAVMVIRNITKLTRLEEALKERYQYHNIIGKSSKMQAIYMLMENLSEIESSVLITGETGTGKELIASAIHHNSMRKNKPFIKVNCSALSENLLESELFGHVKGAFTGAVKNKTGRFEAADHGTIFLDELGDISPLVQLKLLRVLQEKEFEKVGDSRTLKADVRVIAATNCDLKEKIRLGEFREDLYYRVKVVDIFLPPLRERRDDIPMLANHFMSRFNRKFKNKISQFSDDVINAFMKYPWPGNIRELEHAIEHGFVLCRSDVMLPDHLPVEIKEFSIAGDSGGKKQNVITREDILRVLKKTDWNKSKAARLLGMGRRTIYRKMEEFNIEKK